MGVPGLLVVDPKKHLQRASFRTVKRPTHACVPIYTTLRVVELDEWLLGDADIVVRSSLFVHPHLLSRRRESTVTNVAAYLDRIQVSKKIIR